MRKKIVLLGAGSVMFTQGLVMDLIKNPGKNKWHLALVDINPDTLFAVSCLVKKVIKAKNADIEISSSTDRRDVLQGADYIVSTIGVGGRRAWEQDVFIPRKYGVYQPVGDTVMPGGISRAMRMIPAIIDVTKDIEKLCPNACFFNYSNPMAIICRSINKTTDLSMTGLCIGVPSMVWYIADFLGLERNKVTSMSVGINHLTFIYDLRYEGNDIWPLVKQKLDKEFKEEFDENIIDRYYSLTETDPFYLGEPFAWNFFKKYGVFPAPGDRHISEFFPERFPEGKYYGHTLGIDAYSFEGVIKIGDEIYENIREIAMSDEPLKNDYFNYIPGEHEQLMEIINSIENDERKIFSVNLPNNGAVSNLPKEAVLELPAVATAMGFRQLYINDFSNVLASMITKHLSIIEVTVDAALKGDKGLFEEAILMGGYISERSEVEKMVGELIKAQIRYLPQFK